MNLHSLSDKILGVSRWHDLVQPIVIETRTPLRYEVTNKCIRGKQNCEDPDKSPWGSFQINLFAQSWPCNKHLSINSLLIGQYWVKLLKQIEVSKKNAYLISLFCLAFWFLSLSTLVISIIENCYQVCEILFIVSGASKHEPLFAAEWPYIRHVSDQCN